MFPAGEQATVAACFRPETEGLLSDFRRPHGDFFFFFFNRSADFVETYQLHSCRLDGSGDWKHVWSYKSIKATSGQANSRPAPADRLIPESLPVFWEASGQPEFTFRAVLL